MDIPVEVLSPDGKIGLSVKTNQPAVVIYTYNFPVKALACYHGVFSLECQALPNACNVDGFGSILLEQGEEFCLKRPIVLLGKNGDSNCVTVRVFLCFLENMV